MKKIKTFSSLFFIIVLFSTCAEENMCDCVKTTGSIIFESRAVSEFDKIIASNNLNVFITQDSIFEVKIEAGENIVPLIKTEVIDGILYLKNKNRCNWVRSYDQPFNVYIKMPYLKSVIANGSGNIKSTNTFTTDTMNVEIKSSGNVDLTVENALVISHIFDSGDLTLHGKTQEHSCYIGGTSFLYAENLQTNYTWIYTYATGNCSVRASDLLICLIKDVGDVYCYGNPTTVEKTISGNGHLYMQ